MNPYRTRTPRALAAIAAAAIVCTPLAGTAVAAPADKPSDPATVITHRGVGDLRLGNGPHAIRAAGGRLLGTRDDVCRGLVLPGREVQRNRTDGFVARGQGLVAVFARRDMETSEGIGIGSRLGAVKKAYPQLSRPSNGYRTAKVGPGIRYQIGFDERRVDQLALVDDDQPCFS